MKQVQSCYDVLFIFSYMEYRFQRKVLCNFIPNDVDIFWKSTL